MTQFKIYTRAAILSKDKKQVLLLKKQASQKIAGGKWLMPGGTVVFNEDIELSLLREIKEEIGLNIVTLKLLTTKKMLIQETHWLGIYYIAEVDNLENLTNNEPGVHEKAKFINLEEVPDFRDYTILQFIQGVDSNIEHFNVTPATIETHSMGKSLSAYVHNKIHNLITINLEFFSRIRVIGNYNRNSLVSKKEKNDKLFNYKRPTAFIDGDILYICCFPGEDYVYHYAKLIATYLDLIRQPKQVSYVLPGGKLTSSAFDATNLAQIPSAEIIIFGNVDKINLFEGSFEGNGDFLWKKGLINGKETLLLGCQFSIWGNAAYHFIKSLRGHIQFSTFIYIGKLGTFDPKLHPNEYIASGGSSEINHEQIVWNNIFKQHASSADRLILGNHVTYASVMDETNLEIAKLKDKFKFIDPEIGHMAKACQETSTQFGYLHVVTDNLARKYDEDLSNERKVEIIHKRTQLFNLISEILLKYINAGE